MANVKAGFLCVLTLLIAGCATVVPPSERLAFAFTGDWDIKHPYQSELPGVYKLTELVRKGQTVNDWSEMLTFQEFSREALTGSPEKLMENLKAQMRRTCPNVVWTVIGQTPTSILYEWRVKDCRPHSDQHEIARIIDGKWNRWRIAYTSRVVEMPPAQREQWIKVLADARVQTSP